MFVLGNLVNGAGEVIDPRDGKQLLNTEAETVIFAVDENFVVHIGFDGARGSPGAVKHETLFHNANVRAAGEVVFSNGQLVGLNDHSGSYGTYGMLGSDPLFGEAVLVGFDRAGVRIRELMKELERGRGKG